MFNPLEQGVNLHQPALKPGCQSGDAVSIPLTSTVHEWQASSPRITQVAMDLAGPPADSEDSRRLLAAQAIKLALPRGLQLDESAMHAIACLVHPLSAARLTARANELPQVRLVSRLNEMPHLQSAPLREGLAFMRSREVLKRALPLRFMSLEKQAYWRERIAGSKRVSAQQVDLLGLFPDVPLTGDSPVRYRAEEGAIAYLLPTKRVALSTVVVARHKLTGELILGRFHAE